MARLEDELKKRGAILFGIKGASGDGSQKNTKQSRYSMIFFHEFEALAPFVEVVAGKNGIALIDASLRSDSGLGEFSA